MATAEATEAAGRARSPRTAVRSARKGASHPDLLVATRKGAFLLRGEAGQRRWTIEEPHFLGHEVNHLRSDPRDPERWLLAVKTGHLGPTVYRSEDAGQTWREAERPPAFPKAPEGQDGPAVERVFCLTPGHPSQPGVWWAGSASPTPSSAPRTAGPAGSRSRPSPPISPSCAPRCGTASSPPREGPSPTPSWSTRAPPPICTSPSPPAAASRPPTAAGAGTH